MFIYIRIFVFLIYMMSVTNEACFIVVFLRFLFSFSSFYLKFYTKICVFCILFFNLYLPVMLDGHSYTFTPILTQYSYQSYFNRLWSNVFLLILKEMFPHTFFIKSWSWSWRKDFHIRSSLPHDHDLDGKVSKYVLY